MSLSDRIVAGDRLALARLLTQIENEQPEGLGPVGHLRAPGRRTCWASPARRHGKSTLVNRLALGSGPTQRRRSPSSPSTEQPFHRRGDPRRPHPHARSDR
jgi:hypothetical protein